ncbi:MAG: universal stress protein [Nocardioides sp.]|nr:universal stress protein [Nocardioides sp.]
MADAPMPAGPDGDVVVGVDGSAASVGAVRYALDEARRSGAVVRVVHVVPSYIPVAPAYALPPDDLEAVGRSVLRQVLHAAGPVGPKVRLATLLRRGSPVASLVDEARTARLLVVGADRRRTVVRVLTGDTSTGVAASATSPVVVVPETWQPGTRRGVVLAGLRNPAHATDLLRAGFALAEERHCRLLVLHAWKMPPWYDDIVFDRVERERWDAQAHDELESLLTAWRARHPGVRAELRTVHDQPAHALVRASVSIDELVLLRRARRVPAALHLGATARSALREAHCPVRIVPPGAQDSDRGDALQETGSVRE